MTKSAKYPAVLRMLLADFPDAVAEHRFHPVRKWRMDFAIPSCKVALEIQGGIWTGGRHSRGSGLLKEYEKLNAAAIAGWRVLFITPQQLHQARMLVWAACYGEQQKAPHKPLLAVAIAATEGEIHRRMADGADEKDLTKLTTARNALRESWE